MITLHKKNIFLSGSAGFLGPKIKDHLISVGANVIDINENIVDISNPSAVEKYVSSLNITFSGMINNAGISFKGKNIPDDKFMETMGVNVFGTYKITESMMPKLKNCASVVNVGSVYGSIVPNYLMYSGNDEQYNNISYGASKASVLQMTKIMAAHYAKRNIRVNAISPGGILGDQDLKFIEKYSQRVPLKRMVQAKEVINCIVFLLSDMSSGITGQNIIVDAGLSIG